MGAFSARWELSVTVISLNCGSESDQKAIREQLARILGSRPFAQSRRMQRFLEYIVVEALAGRSDRLKAYNIALEVFDRPETFDPIVDPLVRVEAARLRQKTSRILRGGWSGRSYSHRPTEGHIHTAHRVLSACNTWSLAGSTEHDNSGSTPRSLAGPRCGSAPLA